MSMYIKYIVVCTVHNNNGQNRSLFNAFIVILALFQSALYVNSYGIVSELYFDSNFVI